MGSFIIASLFALFDHDKSAGNSLLAAIKLTKCARRHLLTARARCILSPFRATSGNPMERAFG
jgi:hypothetical protein